MTIHHISSDYITSHLIISHNITSHHTLYRRGERMSVEGPSGLGKTRLLRAIAQLDKPVGGSMSIIEVRVL
jgi:ABC-type sugar transport system ATPase subunit